MKRVLYAIATISTIAALATPANAADRVVASSGAVSQPRLVVGIVVDRLRTDHIEELQAYFGEKGFRTLLEQGACLRDIDFKVANIDATTATAMLQTGAYPSQTGVPSGMLIDPENPSAAARPVLAAQGTPLTNDSFTPDALRLSTLSDEIAVGRHGETTIYSVAMDPQQAILLAGHAGTGAIWLNNTTGNWATTNYYGALPTTVGNRNFRNSVSAKIDTMQWRPLAETVRATGIYDAKKQFRYQFSHSDRDVYKKFASSALANSEITDVAIDLLKQLPASGQGTDVLNLAYSVAPYRYSVDGGEAEATDSYIRLDRQLGRLFDAIDRYVGAGNAVIWLTGTGHNDEAVLEEKRYRLPGGEFSVKRARSLLNSYLSARHGAAGYVEAIRDRNVYFNRKTLEERRLDPTAVIADARNFLTKMSGVADALTLDDILSPTTDETRALRLATDPRFSGDILLEYVPGWHVVDDEQYPPVTKSYRLAPALTPAFIIAPGVSAQKIDTPVNATALAPTVAGILRIRSPNGTRDKALPIQKSKF